MILRNLIFKTEVVKQRLRAGMVSHHEQQASKCHGEQQHRELWPAYNANVAPSQASTEGLFQQTLPISPTETCLAQKRDRRGAHKPCGRQLGHSARERIEAICFDAWLDPVASR